MQKKLPRSAGPKTPDFDHYKSQPDRVTPLPRARVPFSGGVLVIDDDLPLHKTWIRLLKWKEVLVAPTGTQGIELFRQNSDRISLVLLDIHLPDMSGKDVLPELRRIAERTVGDGGEVDGGGVKIVTYSGDLKSEIDGADARLQKPFTGAELKVILDGLFLKE